MKFKKIMLITFLLLAVLTLGTVSASDGGDYNQTLTAEDNHQVLADGNFTDDGGDVNPDDELFPEDAITEENFDFWMSSHEQVSADWDPWIVQVHADDNVQKGDLNLTITMDGSVIFSELKNVEDVNEDGDIFWSLNDLREFDILDEAGTYTISLKYADGDTVFDLVDGQEFVLTQFDYNVYEGGIYIEYPFDVIRIWSENIKAEVYVNDKQVSDNGNDNPLRWKLSDLGIDEVGDYQITIKSYEDDDFVEEFTFNLNVDEDTSYFRLMSNNPGVEEWELEDSVLYLISPDDMLGETVTMIINDEESDFEIASTLMSWTLEDLGIDQNEGFDIRIIWDGEDVASTYFNVFGFPETISVDVWDDERALYTDTLGYVVSIRVPEGTSGMVDVIVNGEIKYHTVITSENHQFDGGFDQYEWSLSSLGITEAGNHNVTLKFIIDGKETVNEYLLNVEDFDNSTFRAKVLTSEDSIDLYLFTPAGETGTVKLTFKGWDDDAEEEYIYDEQSFELDESYWNKWVMISDYMNYGDRVDIEVNGEQINVEYSYDFNGYSWNSFLINEDNLYSSEDIVLWVYANSTDNDYTINITSGKYTFYKKITELGDYEWLNGNYKYFITLKDLDSFSTLSDKDSISIFYDVGDGKSLANGWLPFSPYVIQKNEEFIRLYAYEDIRIDLIKIEKVGGEEEEDEEEEQDSQSDIPVDEIPFVRITVPDSVNITQSGVVHISYRDYEAVKNLRDMEYEYDYGYLGKVYYIFLGDLNLTNVQHHDVVNISVTSNDEMIGSKNFVMISTDEGWAFDEYRDIEFVFHYGQIGALEFGQGEPTDTIIEVIIPEYLNVTEGVITIADENGDLIFSKSLSELRENTDYNSREDTRGYWISANLTDFDYDIFKDNKTFTASFTYGNNNSLIAKGIREGNELHRINTPEEIAKLFKVTVSQGVLVNGSENAIIIEATDDANRQSILIDLGLGYFVVYVNDKKVEDLGRLVRVDNETELELFRLTGGSEGLTKLYIYLSDLNIKDNGFYNIRVMHHSENGLNAFADVEMFNQNITLTSNVKVDNVTSDVFTGFGMDPVLMYLDTYYGEIDSVTGTVTVLNSSGDEIFKSDIRSLSSDEQGRYLLKYSDFENKNFGDTITVMYEGSERSGNTTVNVTWKDVDADDFAPVVKNDTVDDYYASFINLDIPDLINDGQIIVTIKFKNNHGANISNMNVTTDFDSQAVYKFNVADIKANYDGGFALSLSDLGFYETNGDYDVDVQFTADGLNKLDVTSNTLNVAFSEEIIIDINDTSRYANSLPFASVKVFEPISAYAELYIDGVLYSHKNFEKGLIVFDSSALWTPGIHTAELVVCDSEFGSVLNSSQKTFETLIQTEDVEVSMDDNVKEGENVFVTINVPQSGDVLIQVDGSAKTYALNKGENTVDLGILDYGNHTVWISYNTTLDDGNVSFYYNYLSIFVGDDGHWLNVPEPLVLDNDDTIKFALGEDAEGYVLVYIDGELVSNITLANGSAEFTLTDLVFSENKYGQHTYNITYSGDKIHDSLSKSGVFNVTYLFKDNLVKEGFPLREYYVIVITLPADANGTVTIIINGKTYTSLVENGQARFEISDLAIGEHDVAVNYSGDEKYPESSYNNVLNVSYYAVVGDFDNGKKVVSLLLPSNATGNLTVYNDNGGSKLYTQALVNGKVSIDLSKLTVGAYDIRAVYEGDDYEVRQFNTEFNVMPKIYITQDITVGEIGQIFVDLDDSTGHLLVLVDGLSPVLMEIEDGKINYTFSTESMSKGNHTVNFQYFGNSFDGNIFYALNAGTGYFMPIDYNMHLLAKEPQVNMTPGDDWVIIDCGNATGTIEVFVNGVREAVVDIVNGIARIDLSQFRDGNYTLTFKYSGDRMYDGFTKDLDVTVVHKTPSITAKNVKVLYSAKGKYSVTVYDENGTVVSGAQVSFVIGGKVYKTAKTNSNGVASIVIGKNPGTYKITAKALDVNVTKTLTVKHLLTLKKVTVKRSAKKLVLTATLGKVNKKYLKNKKITFKFNGKKYTAKTNKKGVAKVTIKSSVLKKLKAGKKVTYQATYLKDTVKKTIKVKK